jgi:hypothetical protein
MTVIVSQPNVLYSFRAIFSILLQVFVELEQKNKKKK